MGDSEHIGLIWLSIDIADLNARSHATKPSSFPLNERQIMVPLHAVGPTPSLSATSSTTLSHVTALQQPAVPSQVFSTPSSNPLQMTSEALAAVIVGVVGIAVAVILVYWQIRSSKRQQEAPAPVSVPVPVPVPVLASDSTLPVQCLQDVV